MRTVNIIRTRNPLLPATLRAIAVCWWSLLADCLGGLRAVTAALWADYRLARAEQRAQAADRAEMLAVLDLRDDHHDGAIETLAREFGRPGWLSAIALALVVAAMVVDVADGWPMVIDAAGAALQQLAGGR